jgi:hypothetical protein
MKMPMFVDVNLAIWVSHTIRRYFAARRQPMLIGVTPAERA